MSKKKWLREFTLGIGSGRTPQDGYRDMPSLLKPPPRRVVNFKRGVPVFSQAIDTIRNLATGNRQYKPPAKAIQFSDNYTDANYHSMMAKFQFYITGSFPQGGSSFEKELYEIAAELNLVGFIKARSQYALGHLQGDAFSLSYIRKWMDRRCNSSGEISSVDLFDESYGIPELRYSKLECIKDWRSPIRRMQHMSSIHENLRLERLQTRSRIKSENRS